jgi:hypothetical protein
MTGTNVCGAKANTQRCGLFRATVLGGLFGQTDVRTRGAIVSSIVARLAVSHSMRMSVTGQLPTGSIRNIAVMMDRGQSPATDQVSDECQ